MNGVLQTIMRISPLALFLQPTLSASQLPTSLANALTNAQTVVKQDSSIELSHSQLVTAFRFIEKEKERPPTQNTVYHENETNVPCKIEWIPSLHAFVISDLPGKSSHIGHGASKTVTKGIFVGSEVAVVAVCDALHEKCAREIQILSRLQGCNGIVTLFGSVPRKAKRCTMYLRYMVDGTLSKRLGPGTLTHDQQIVIARDVAQGLAAMHEKL